MAVNEQYIADQDAEIKRLRDQLDEAIKVHSADAARQQRMRMQAEAQLADMRTALESVELECPACGRHSYDNQGIIEKSLATDAVKTAADVLAAAVEWQGEEERRADRPIDPAPQRLTTPCAPTARKDGTMDKDLQITHGYEQRHDPADVEWMARLICVALDQDPDAWEHLRTPGEVNRALDYMQARGEKVTTRDEMPTPNDIWGDWTDQAKQCWQEAHDAAPLTPRD